MTYNFILFNYSYYSLKYMEIPQTISRDSSVSIATRLQAGRPGFDVGTGREVFSLPPRPDRLWGPMDDQGSFPAGKAAGMLS
jgi:hypothetical protein